VDRQQRLSDVLPGVEPGVEGRPEIDLHAEALHVVGQVEPEVDGERSRRLSAQVGDCEQRPAEPLARLEPVLRERVAAGTFERDGEVRDRTVDDGSEPQPVALDPESFWERCDRNRARESTTSETTNVAAATSELPAV
jgi:hypothetical protein